MKTTTIAAHLVHPLRKQQRPGQMLSTPCPHCGTSMSRTELAAHAASCQEARTITINSPESMGRRGHDDMIDA
ncbi:MAG: hypothetical protein JSU00_24045 [Acidobacteria bacterium]|nr:hypothetical protein [Acidobacteriota bacterium]